MTYYLCQDCNGYFRLREKTRCPNCGSTSEAHCVANGGRGRVFYMTDTFEPTIDKEFYTKKAWEIAHLEAGWVKTGKGKLYKPCCRPNEEVILKPK